MDDELAQTVAAAHAILAADPDDVLMAELAAWQLGAVGEPVPALTHPVALVHAQLAAAAGAIDLVSVEGLLDATWRHRDGDYLLSSACELLGRSHADALVEVVHRQPGRRFIGRMLACTSRPARLLALFSAEIPDIVAIETIGEW